MACSASCFIWSTFSIIVPTTEVALWTSEMPALTLAVFSVFFAMLIRSKLFVGDVPVYLSGLVNSIFEGRLEISCDMPA